MRTIKKSDMGLSAISLFSGVGGLDLAAKWAGIKTVAYVEYDPYAQQVLLSRMRDGSLDDAPIFEDVRTFRGTSLRGSVDVVFGGFPCQDLSIAGKRDGIKEGNRSGLWKEFARIIREVGPRFVLVENVSGLLVGGAMGIVLGDLARFGYDAEWYSYLANWVRAPHERLRVWIVAYPRGEFRINPGTVLGQFRKKIEWTRQSKWSKDWIKPEMGPWRNLSPTRLQEISGCSEPPLLRMDDGVAERMDNIKGELKCIGNGVVPQQALPAFQKIIEMAKNRKDGPGVAF